MLNFTGNFAFNANFYHGRGVDWDEPTGIFFHNVAKFGQTILCLLNRGPNFFVVSRKAH